MSREMSSAWAAGVIAVICVAAGCILAANILVVLVLVNMAGWLTSLMSLVGVVGLGALLALAQFYGVGRFFHARFPDATQEMVEYTIAHKGVIMLAVIAVFIALRFVVGAYIS